MLEQFSYLIEPSPIIFPIAAWLADNAFPWSGEYLWWRRKLVNDLVILPDASLRRMIDSCLQLARPDSPESRFFPSETLFYSVLEPSLWEKKFERTHVVISAPAAPGNGLGVQAEAGIFAARLVRFAKRKKRKKRPPGKPALGTAPAAAPPGNTELPGTSPGPVHPETAAPE